MITTVSKNSVIPASVTMTFPKYVVWDDPVPHFVNPRYAHPRPSCTYEDSYALYSVQVPITSGGISVSDLTGVNIVAPFAYGDKLAPVTSGMTVVSGSTHVIHTTAKAYMSGEASYDPVEQDQDHRPIADQGQLLLDIYREHREPFNKSGLIALAMQTARDYYDSQVLKCLDQTFPGIVPWSREGIHDIVWTYRAGQASTRVMRSPWNQTIRNMQHASPPHTIPPPGTYGAGGVEIESSGYAMGSIPRGVGGPSVALTVRDQDASYPSRYDPTPIKLALPLLENDYEPRFTTINYLPTNRQWRGRIDDEIILFAGTSGGIPTFNGFRVTIINRGLEGSTVADHSADVTIIRVFPNVNYGTNLITFREGQFISPGKCTSGGIHEVIIEPQITTIHIPYDLSTTAPHLIGGTLYYPAGKVLYRNTTNDVIANAQTIGPDLSPALHTFGNDSYAFALGGKPIRKGTYLGHLMGYMASGGFLAGGSQSKTTAPVYAIAEQEPHHHITVDCMQVGEIPTAIPSFSYGPEFIETRGSAVGQQLVIDSVPVSIGMTFLWMFIGDDTQSYAYGYWIMVQNASPTSPWIARFVRFSTYYLSRVTVFAGATLGRSTWAQQWLHPGWTTYFQLIGFDAFAPYAAASASVKALPLSIYPSRLPYPPNYIIPGNATHLSLEGGDYDGIAGHVVNRILHIYNRGTFPIRIGLTIPNVSPASKCHILPGETKTFLAAYGAWNTSIPHTQRFLGNSFPPPRIYHYVGDELIIEEGITSTNWDGTKFTGGWVTKTGNRPDYATPADVATAIATAMATIDGGTW